MEFLCKSTIVTLLIALLSTADIAPLWAAEAAAPARVRIGVITPLTGSLVSSGASVRDSILLADELYDRTNAVEFIIQDDGFAPKNSVSIARKFIEERTAAIIIFGTPTALAVAPVTEQAGMPLAAISILDKVAAGRKYTVRHFVSWKAENERVLAEVRRRGYRRVAVVTTTNDASLALRDGFLAAGLVTTVYDQEFARDELDFRTVAARIKALKPDAVYNLLFAPQGSAFMKALREINCHAPVFAVHNVEDPDEVAAARGAYEGIWYVTGADRAGSFYYDAYRGKYGRAPAMGGANAFDYAKMLIEAVQNGVPLMQQLHNLRDFVGAFGRYGTAPGNTFALTAAVREIHGGAFVETVR